MTIQIQKKKMKKKNETSYFKDKKNMKYNLAIITYLPQPRAVQDL